MYRNPKSRSETQLLPVLWRECAWVPRLSMAAGPHGAAPKEHKISGHLRLLRFGSYGRLALSAHPRPLRELLKPEGGIVKLGGHLPALGLTLSPRRGGSITGLGDEKGLVLTAAPGMSTKSLDKTGLLSPGRGRSLRSLSIITGQGSASMPQGESGRHLQIMFKYQSGTFTL